MEESSSYEATSCPAGKEIPVFAEHEGSYCAHKSPPLGPILSQLNLVHIIAHYLLEIHFNIILSHTTRSHMFPTPKISYAFPISPPRFM
jgi:hypothetical protein